MIYFLLFMTCIAVGSLIILKSPPRPRYAYSALVPAMFMLLLPAALRFRTGWDWESYDLIFSMTSLSTFGQMSGDYLFDVTLLLSKWLGLTPYVLPAAVIVLSFFLVLVRRSVSYLAVPISLILFLWYGYYSAWSTIRQGMSIAVISIGFLDIKPRYKYLFFLMAILLHKTAVVPVAVYFLWRLLSAFSRRTLLLLGISALILVLLIRNVSVLDLISKVDVLSLIGENRAVSFSQREFLLASYPFYTGRMAELLLSIGTLAFALKGKWRLPEDDSALAPQASTSMGLLLMLQCQHLLVYILCSPLTVVAERMVLYYDVVHALALGGAMIVLIRVVSGAIRPRGISIEGTRLLLGLAFLVSAGYIANRYYNIFHAESREIGELTHAERFFPYRSILE